MRVTYVTKEMYLETIQNYFTNLFLVKPHFNSHKTEEGNAQNWSDAVKFALLAFQGSDCDSSEEFETFMEQITGNFGRPDPVESIIAAYYGLTEEIINTVLEAIDNA